MSRLIYVFFPWQVDRLHGTIRENWEGDYMEKEQELLNHIFDISQSSLTLQEIEEGEREKEKKIEKEGWHEMWKLSEREGRLLDIPLEKADYSLLKMLSDFKERIVAALADPPHRPVWWSKQITF